METLAEMEMHLIENAKKYITELRILLKTNKTKMHYTTFMIPSDFTFDQVVYDNKLKKFVKINYMYWDGVFEHDAESKSIDISKMDL